VYFFWRALLIIHRELRHVIVIVFHWFCYLISCSSFLVFVSVRVVSGTTLVFCCVLIPYLWCVVVIVSRTDVVHRTKRSHIIYRVFMPMFVVMIQYAYCSNNTKCALWLITVVLSLWFVTYCLYLCLYLLGSLRFSCVGVGPMLASLLVGCWLEEGWDGVLWPVGFF
jgi:hypothetical protein